MIANVKNRKPPGNDENRMLQYASFLRNIINAMMKLQYFFRYWKFAALICVQKSDKPPSIKLQTITLLSYLSKVADEKSSSNRANKKHGCGHQL